MIRVAVLAVLCMGQLSQPATGQLYVAARDSTPADRARAQYTCNGDDLTVVQQAVDDAQAMGYNPPTVVLLAGGYRFAGTLYLGYQGRQPAANGGCGLVGQGHVSIAYTGPTVAGTGFVLQACPSSAGLAPTLANLQLVCNHRIGGVYLANHNGGTGHIRDLRIWGARGFGLVAHNAWFGRFARLRIDGGRGMPMLLTRANALTATDMVIGASYTDEHMPAVCAYPVSSFGAGGWATTLWPCEPLQGTDDQRAIFLGWLAYNGYHLIVAHDTGGPFAPNQIVQGLHSKHTVTLAGEPRDLRAAVGLLGQCGNYQQWNLEGLGYTDNHPLVRVIGDSNVLNGWRFEADPRTDAFRRQSTVYFSVEDSRHVVIRNVLAGSRAYPCRATACTVDGKDVTLTAEFEDRLQLNDVVSLTGPSFLPGQYRVTHIDDEANRIRLDRAAPTTSEATVYGVTLAQRTSPQTCIRLRNSHRTQVANLCTAGFTNSLVDIGPKCLGTRVSNLSDVYVDQGIKLWLPTPEVLVKDQGRETLVQ